MTGRWAAIGTVAKRELAAYFESPVAYVFLVIFLLLAGFFTFTFGGFFERGEASLAAFFNWLPWLFLFLVPAAGMRLWSEERRLGTIELLLTMPVATWQAILGKFLASWLFLVIALALTFPIVVTANWLGDPDNGVIASGYVGAALLAGAYLAVSCMTSALTRNQVIAFILAVVLCLLLILVGFSPLTDLLARWASPWLVEAVTKFSVLTHYDGFQKGVLESRDLLYFLSVMAFTLFATGVVIRSHRAGERRTMQKKTENLLYSGGGLVAAFVILILANLVLGAARGRIDLTQGKLFTLSEGTRAVLAKLESPVKIRFYFTQGDAGVPLPIKAYGRRVEDLLAEFRQAGRGKVLVEKLDPQPDSDAEDSATLEGIEAQVTSTGEKFYLGAAVSYADQKLALPALTPDREPLLEYDLVRAIPRVTATSKPVVGVMSALPVFGMPPSQFTGGQPLEPQVFVGELRRDYTVKRVSLGSERIDDDIKV